MPESRDRLSRPEDISAIFARRRQSLRSIGILADEPDMGSRTPFRWGTTAMTGPVGVVPTRGGGRFGRGSLGTPRTGNGRGRILYGSPAVGRENITAGSGRRARGRSTNSVLPSWYPRTPLRDVTSIVRAIERRRARLREIEGLEIESPIPQDQVALNDSTISTPGAQLEHNISMMSPSSTIRMKPGSKSIGKVSKILLDITNQNAGESDILTPQKKLLNSIDTVEKVVMEELNKLKRTPSAKRAEREKRVRTLMSMR
ncbi:protein POLYCHOME-like [Cornus florida]|uniref:protein POLYCHOME-like n=1 Tax=Cornus florida TaxID=4283 RepID=UPI00289ED444|nr:protein POLYCHOME-like [Cornus florida]